MHDYEIELQTALAMAKDEDPEIRESAEIEAKLIRLHMAGEKQTNSDHLEVKQ